MFTKDKYNFDISGELTILENKLDSKENIEVLQDSNLVVTKAREIMRDLVFGENKRISKIKFGDLGLSQGDDLINIEQPSLMDTSLKNSVFEKVITNITKDVIDGRPSLKFEVTLTASECNGSGTQILVEAGLFNSNNELFARKTFPVCVKSENNEFTFIWIIKF
jgi:hypothetical protein